MKLSANGFMKETQKGVVPCTSSHSSSSKARPSLFSRWQVPTPRGKLIALIPEFARLKYALLHASVLYGDEIDCGRLRELERVDKSGHRATILTKWMMP